MQILTFQFPRHVITGLPIEGGSLLLHLISVSILVAAILRDGHEIDFGPRKDIVLIKPPERGSVCGVCEEVERNGIVLRVLAGFSVERARFLVVSAQRKIDGRLSEFVAGMVD